jgi:hypothetical protein
MTRPSFSNQAGIGLNVTFEAPEAPLADSSPACLTSAMQLKYASRTICNEVTGCHPL